MGGHKGKNRKFGSRRFSTGAIAEWILIQTGGKKPSNFDTIINQVMDKFPVGEAAARSALFKAIARGRSS